MLCLTHNYCLLKGWMMRDKKIFFLFLPCACTTWRRRSMSKECNGTDITSRFFFPQRDYVAHHYSTLLCLLQRCDQKCVQFSFEMPSEPSVHILLYNQKPFHTQVSENPKSYSTPFRTHTGETRDYNWPSYRSIFSATFFIDPCLQKHNSVGGFQDGCDAENNSEGKRKKKNITQTAA